jgi:hypothetical protein
MSVTTMVIMSYTMSLERSYLQSPWNFSSKPDVAPYRRTTWAILYYTAGVLATGRNHTGETELHFAAGMNPHGHLPTSQDPIEILLNLEIGANVNVEDNNGLVAKLLEKVIERLIRAGAQLTVCTNESQSLLHIASRSRQCNIVLDQYATQGRLLCTLTQNSRRIGFIGRTQSLRSKESLTL